MSFAIGVLLSLHGQDESQSGWLNAWAVQTLRVILRRLSYRSWRPSAAATNNIIIHRCVHACTCKWNVAFIDRQCAISWWNAAIEHEVDYLADVLAPRHAVLYEHAWSLLTTTVNGHILFH